MAGDRLSSRRAKGGRDVPSRLVDGDVSDKPPGLCLISGSKGECPLFGVWSGPIWQAGPWEARL